MKEEKKFANEIELICAINSTMNRQSQLDCITSAGRPNFPIYKALVVISQETFEAKILSWLIQCPIER